jgi:hypothetical protein
MVAGSSIAAVFIPNGFRSPTVARPEDFAPCGRSPSQGAFLVETSAHLGFSGRSEDEAFAPSP